MENNAAADPATQPSEPVLPTGVLLDDVPFATYRADSGINASGLKTLLRSGAHWQCEQQTPEGTPTPAQQFGSLVHAAVLEPKRFAAHMATPPEVNLRTKQGKEDLAAWRATLSPEAIEVPAAQVETLQGVVDAVRAHPRLSRLLARGRREVCLFWQDPQHHVRCRARYDFVAADTNIIVDIKTTLDARPESFGADSVRYHYPLSAAHYLEGARATGVADPHRFVLVAVEKNPPYGIRLYEMSAAELARGLEWRQFAMARYAACLRQGEWPGYSADFAVLEATAWAPYPPPLQNA